MTMAVFNLSRRRPRLVKALVRRGVEAPAAGGYRRRARTSARRTTRGTSGCAWSRTATCSRRSTNGSASIVTDTIETFTETGIRLESGERARGRRGRHRHRTEPRPARRDPARRRRREVSLPETMGYKGMMLSGVPNMAFAVGYTNASWTLKADLTCEYVCRAAAPHGRARLPRRRRRCNRDPSVEPEPFIDFTSGYVMRAIDKFPKQGSKAPWRLHQNYARDILAISARRDRGRRARVQAHPGGPR